MPTTKEIQESRIAAAEAGCARTNTGRFEGSTARHCHQWPPMPAEAVIIRARSPGGDRLPFLDRVTPGGAENLPCGLVEKLAAPEVGQGQGTVSIVQWPKGSGSAKAGCLDRPRFGRGPMLGKCSLALAGNNGCLKHDAAPALRK